MALAVSSAEPLLVFRKTSAQGPLGFTSGWRRVLYDRAEQKKLLHWAIVYIFEHAAQWDKCASAYLLCVGFMKHPAYQVEQEVRYLFHWFDGLEGADFISVRPATGADYVELVGGGASPTVAQRFSSERVLPKLNAVALAPPRKDPSQNRTPENVRELLADVQVVRSNIAARI